MIDQAKQIDDLAIKIENLTRYNEQLEQRSTSQDGIIKAILETMKKGEDLFELRVSRVLHGLMKGLTHQLEHSIEHAQDELRLEQQGFNIMVVDGVKVKEGPQTILVTKTETGYDYSPASAPENVQNEGTETFSNYFNNNPQVFGDATELLVNIEVLAREPEKVTEDV